MAGLRSVQSVADVVDNLPSSGRVLVAIVGSPGAGKSTIAEALVARLPDAALLPMDGFHLPQAELRRLGRRDRMGAPDTFDVDGFLAVLRALRAGEAVTAPGFDREVEEAVPGSLRVDAPVVIVEGNYLLLDSGGWEAAAPLFDATFFVEVERGIRLERLIKRHERFGKSPTDARAWALGPDESNALLIEATAARADHRIRLP
ncbi:MAG: nucleoside/nucleotide kinase family protein [Rhodoglobus sp.]